jgi:hypothetical protein
MSSTRRCRSAGQGQLPQPTVAGSTAADPRIPDVDGGRTERHDRANKGLSGLAAGAPTRCLSPEITWPCRRAGNPACLEPSNPGRTKSPGFWSTACRGKIPRVHRHVPRHRRSRRRGIDNVPRHHLSIHDAGLRATGVAILMCRAAADGYPAGCRCCAKICSLMSGSMLTFVMSPPTCFTSRGSMTRRHSGGIRARRNIAG